MDADSSSAGARAKRTTARKSPAEQPESKPASRRAKKGVTGNEGVHAAVELPVSSEFNAEFVDVEKGGNQGGTGMSQTNQTVQNQDQDSEQDYSDEPGSIGQSEQDDYYGEQYEDGAEYYGSSDPSVGQNQIVVTLSYSLMNQVRQTARMEGVLPEDIIVELVAEGVTRRAFEDAQRPAPSHLMTRTGYVAPDANGNVLQPQLSHHGMQGNGRQNQNRRFNQNNNNNRGHHHQGRNRQNNHFKNKQRNGK